MGTEQEKQLLSENVFLNRMLNFLDNPNDPPTIRECMELGVRSGGSAVDTFQWMVVACQEILLRPFLGIFGLFFI